MVSSVWPCDTLKHSNMEGSFICLCLTACLPAVQQRPYVADFNVCSMSSSINLGAGW